MKGRGDIKRILIVEDQLIIALDLRFMLESMGYTVVGLAGTARECLDSLASERPDLILMDIMLSGDIDGIAAANMIHENFEVPVIFITAHSDAESLSRANLTGPYGYIVKPIDEKDLYITIEIALQRFSIDRELKQSEMKYRTLFEESLDPIFITDESAIIIDANQSMINLFGYSLKELVNRKAEDLFQKQDDFFQLLDEVKLSGGVSSYDCRMLSRSGRIIYVQITMKEYKYGKEQGNGYQGIIRDITKDKLYFNELLNSRQELRNLSAHIESLREKERTDIAREIHDVLGQSLTALRIDLSWIRKRINLEDRELIDKISVMDNLINDIIITVRRLSANLRPGILDDLGLAAAIEWQVDEFRRRTGYTCNVRCDEIVFLSEDKAVALFRILQESLTNIIRHAHADMVDVSLVKGIGCVEMTVRDNGHGFNAKEGADKGSYGIIGMKERVNSFKGSISIDSRIGGPGTTVRVIIPL